MDIRYVQNHSIDKKSRKLRLHCHDLYCLCKNQSHHTFFSYTANLKTGNCHSVLSTGHFSQHNTFEEIRTYLFWYKIAADTKITLFKLQHQAKIDQCNQAYIWSEVIVTYWVHCPLRRTNRQNRRLIDWLLGFNARTTIFQLYSGDEHDMDDKMNMKC